MDKRQRVLSKGEMASERYVHLKDGKGECDVNPRPRKVLRIIGRMNVGGPAIHVVLLTAGLKSQEFCSILVTGMAGKSEGDMLYFAQRHDVTPLIIPELGREISWRDDLVALWKLYKICLKERPDIVHTHTSKAGALGRVAAVLARIPIRVHTFHGHVFDGYFSPLKTKLVVLIERVLALITTKIVVISNKQLLDLSSRYRIAARDKFSVIPIGLELAPLLQSRKNNGRQISTLSSQALIVGFVGRLVPIKNPSMAIKAFERLVRAGEAAFEARLIVAGDGELRPELQQKVSQGGLEDRVTFIGWQQDLPSLYSCLDILILTSLNEGTPVVLIEAMASGIPFVASRVGAVADLMVGPEQIIRTPTGLPLFSLFANGVLVEPSDAEGFTAAMKYLLSDRERMHHMGMEGKRFVREKFSRERLVREIQALYHDCFQGYAARTLGQFSGSVGPEGINKKVRA